VRELSRELEWIPLKALRKDRDRRYASVEQLDADIENYLEGRPLIAGPESRRYRLRKFVSRNRAEVTASGLAAVSLFAGVTGWTVSVQRERDRTDAARQTSDAVAGFAQNAFLQASPYVGNANATLADGVRAAVLDLQQSDTLVNAPALRAQLEVRIAEILIDVGEFDSAGVQAQSALDRLAGMSDAPAGTLIAAHNVLGTAQLQQNQPEKALEHYNAAFAIVSPEPGPKSLARADHLNKTGSVYLKLRDFSKAQDAFEQALAIHQSQPVPDRKSIAATLNMLGSLFDQQQQFDQAGDYYSRMLEIRREILKPDDIALAQGLNNLGSVLAKQKQFAPAATMLAEALAIYDARASSSHPDSLRCRATLASAQRNLNQLDESVVNYQQAIAGMRDRQPLMAGDLANARSGLGRTLLLVPGREDDAKDNLLAAFEYRLSMNDPGMNVTAAALVELFERTNQPEQARAIKARLESSQNSSPTGDRK